MLRLIGLLIIIYPVIAHIGLWAAYPTLAVSYLIGLILLALLFPEGYTKATNILAAIVILATVALLYFYKKTFLLIYLPPTIIPFYLMILFGRTLQKGQVPMITKFAEKMENQPFTEEKKKYTRDITLLWTVVFAFMVVESLTLAILTPIRIWSWATHVGNYLLIAIVFLSEFIYRRMRFKESHRDLRAFVNSVVRHRWK